MRTRFSMLTLTLALMGAPAIAQDGIMGSAETINPGNFKFMAYPVLLLQGDSDLGVGARVGYGVSQDLDVEAKVAFFDGVTFLGLDAEYWLIKGPLNVSVSGGGHYSKLGEASVFGLDGIVQASGKLQERLELYLGFDVALEFPEEPFDNFTRLYLVPGAEYKVSDEIDIVAEFGAGLNDNARNYVSGGVAYYLR